jgi:serine phosphatase RsbU (regulator of sigma subunit)
MKRELQMARDIQQEFLPKEIPVLSSWDVDVRWHPARQVGGDFYDVFRLPDNKLGLVIADVADKGLPAALYMVLVRTLISCYSTS